MGGSIVGMGQDDASIGQLMVDLGRVFGELSCDLQLFMDRPEGRRVRWEKKLRLWEYGRRA